jgi:hypothetical protein
MPLFDCFAISIVICGTAAALFILFETISDTSFSQTPSGQETRSLLARVADHAIALKATRFAVSTIVATAFGVLEYISHRVLLALQFTADVQAICDGSIVALAGAATAWAFLSAMRHDPVDEGSLAASLSGRTQMTQRAQN